MIIVDFVHMEHVIIVKINQIILWVGIKMHVFLVILNIVNIVFNIIN